MADAPRAAGESAERSTPPPLGATVAPAGPVLHGWFAGILEGRIGDVPELEAAVRRLNATELAAAELEIDGGRFSVLVDEAVVAGERFDPQALDDFVRALERSVGSSSDPSRVESTLRCIAVHEDGVVETLFAVTGGHVQCLSQVRDVQPADLDVPSLARVDPAIVHMGRRQAALIGALLFLGFGLLMWQNGVVGRAFGTDAGKLTESTGPFGELVGVEVGQSWGNYEVKLGRGEDYPATPAEAGLLEGSAASSLERAAVNAVADGGEIYVRLVDREGNVISSQEISLSALLSQADAVVEAKLTGSIAAYGIELALDSGEDGR